MIILRQKEYGNKENKAAKRLYEVGQGKKILGSSSKEIKDDYILPIIRNSQSSYESRNKLIKGLKDNYFKLTSGKDSIDHKVNIRGYFNTAPNRQGRPWKDSIFDNWKGTHEFIKNSTTSK